MAFGVKTNERPGTRASVNHVRVSAYKAREVLDLIRGQHINEADALLALTERGVAPIIRKLLASAVANAQNNDDQDADALYVSACYADEGPTLKRWRPRARGRATRIRKRTCHITIIVSRLSDDELRLRAEKEAARSARGGRARRTAASAAESRRRRVAASRRRRGEAEPAEAEPVVSEPEATEAPGEEAASGAPTAPVGSAEGAAEDVAGTEVTEPEAVEGELTEADAVEAATSEPDSAESTDADGQGEEASTAGQPDADGDHDEGAKD